MIFKTISGSRYQANEVEKKIRRLGNDNNLPSTVRLGGDGEWRQYRSLSVMAGEPALIVWEPGSVDLLPDTNVSEGGWVLPTTMTSTVLEIIDLELPAEDSSSKKN